MRKQINRGLLRLLVSNGNAAAAATVSTICNWFLRREELRSNEDTHED